MKFTAEQQLDAGLRFVYENNQFRYHRQFGITALIDILFDTDTILDHARDTTIYDNGFPELEGSIVLEEVISKLADDGYLYKSGDTYSTNLAGRHFIAQGGYKASRISQELLVKSKILEGKLLLAGSWMAGIGSLFLIVIEVVKFFERHYGNISLDLKCCLILFAFGVLTGIPIAKYITRFLPSQNKTQS